MSLCSKKLDNRIKIVQSEKSCGSFSFVSGLFLCFVLFCECICCSLLLVFC